MDSQVVTPLHNALPDSSGIAPGFPKVTDDWLDHVADGLGEYGWLTLDAGEVLGKELLLQIAEEVAILDRTDNLRRAGVGRGLDHTRDRSVRRDKIAWLQGVTQVQQQLFYCLGELQNGLNRRLFLGLKRFEAHYATYHEGDFYRKHLDSFRGRASRVVSVVLYLNDGWQSCDGGALQVFNRDNENEVCGVVTPEMGRMVIFMSEEVPHEVLPANRTRYSVACWFRQDEVPLPL